MGLVNWLNQWLDSTHGLGNYEIDKLIYIYKKKGRNKLIINLFRKISV